MNKYISYKGYEKSFIVESSLSRIAQHVNNGFFIVSADRGERTPDENALKQIELVNTLKSKRMGYIPMVGSYIENFGEDNELEVTEVSFFVPRPTSVSTKDFLDLAIDLMLRYDQESVLYSENGQGMYYITDVKGREIEYIGKALSVNDIGAYYSRLKKGSHRDTKFVFEGVIKPAGNLRLIYTESRDYSLVRTR